MAATAPNRAGRWRAALTALALAAAGPAFAVEPGERLSDPALEARARDLSAELRCLVCQNQSIDDSNAALARDLRVLLRERLAAGDSDDQVRQFMTVRYGDFVLLRPPIRPETYLLWFGPAAAAVLGVFGIVRFFRRRRRGITPAAPLSAEEKKRLETLMEATPR
ncbi:MAG: cytochrome c-type biogenesis protein CcmH [Rhodospirillaceae bacterium]|nr:cytochrome c-type biogenesis protein CcmH [Rhodospirillaceae bacterium]